MSKKLYWTKHNRRVHIGYYISDEEFLAMTAEELRDAIRAGLNDWVFWHPDEDGEGEGCLSLIYDDDAEELTLAEFDTLTADQLREAILNTHEHDVYRVKGSRSKDTGSYRVFQCEDLDISFQDGSESIFQRTSPAADHEVEVVS
jgi:hypothetical protein